MNFVGYQYQLERRANMEEYPLANKEEDKDYQDEDY